MSMYFDLETTGYKGLPMFGKGHKIIHFAVVCGDFKFVTYVNPGIPIQVESTHIHGITDADVEEAPSISEVWKDLCRISPFRVLVAHNCFAFDQLILEKELRECGLSTIGFVFHDTEPVVRQQYPDLESHSLKDMIEYFNISSIYDKGHDALADARALQRLCQVANIETFPFETTPKRVELKSIWPIKKDIATIREMLDIGDSVDELAAYFNNDATKIRKWFADVINLDLDAIEFVVLRALRIEPREFIWRVLFTHEE